MNTITMSYWNEYTKGYCSECNKKYNVWPSNIGLNSKGELTEFLVCPKCYTTMDETVNTITTLQFISAIVPVHNRLPRTTRVIKRQLFTAEANIKHHLISNTYHDLNGELIDIIQEKCYYPTNLIEGYNKI